MRYYAYGNHRYPVSSNRAMFADTTRQRDARQSARPERHLVRCRAGLQMARAAQTVRQLAHHLYAHELVVEERGVGSRLCTVATGQIIRVKVEAMAVDSTLVKVHPDGTGALKKRPASHWPVPRRMDDQDSSGCRGCSNGPTLCLVPWPGPRCPRWDASCSTASEKDRARSPC